MSPGFLAGNEIHTYLPKYYVPMHLLCDDRLVQISLENFLLKRNYSFIINNYSSPLWFHHQFCVAKMLLMNIELQRIAKAMAACVSLGYQVLESQVSKSKRIRIYKSI